MKPFKIFSFLPLFLVLLVQFIRVSLGAIVDQNGGYTLVIGIHRNETKPNNLDAYINNIKAAISSFSFQMWIATHENFFVRNLQIIAPATWDLSSNLTAKSFSTSDIRLSSSVQFPQVDNPNLCGLPGNFMLLPFNTFETSHSGKYGEHWKVLLVNWAKYRWGVHDEHGLPGDKRFPYFTKALAANETQPKWLLNGCTNAQGNKLDGEYRMLNRTLCDATSESELNLECRFFPDKNANYDVTSSLMHFHFMESVNKFCDSTTHQRHVPTKQNLFCDNKSIMEIIESTSDFKGIVEKAQNVPALKTEILSAASSKPALYLLLDSGIADYEDTRLINKAFLEFGKFFANVDPNLYKDLVVSVAQFPSKQNGLYVEELVPLGLLHDNRDLVIDAVGNHKIVNSTTHDFGIALEQAASAIKAHSPSEGGNILFLKTTGATNSLKFTIEKELELFLRAEKIKLFTLEIVDHEFTRQNLAQIASATQGDAIAIRRADDVGEQIPLDISTWLNYVVLSLYSKLPETGRVERIVLTEIVEPSKIYKIPVLAKTDTLTFILTTTGGIVAENVEAGIITPEITIRAKFTEQKEFGQNRRVYVGVLDTSDWTVNQVSFQYPGTQNGRLTVLSNGVDLPGEISVSVVTSAADNILDYQSIKNPNAPFVLSAMVLQGKMNVVGARVIATIQHGDGIIQTLQLSDSSPDLVNPAGDGIYSEIALLSQNGEYSISVTVTKDTSVTFDALPMTFSFITPDQQFETIQPVVFPAGVTKVARLGSNILVTNVDKFEPTVQKIRDLTVTISEMNPINITFEFTTPRVLNLENGGSSPMIYTFYSSESLDLLSDFNTENLPPGVKLAFSETGGETPGSLKRVSISVPRASYTYYVVVGRSSTVYLSLPSNIVGVTEAEEQSTTTTPETSTDVSGSSTDVPDSTTDVSGSSTDVPDSTTDVSGSSTDVSGSSTDVPDSTSDGSGNSTDVPGTSTDGTSTGTTPSSVEPDEDKKPWAGTPVGIIVIIAIIVAILGAAFIVYRCIKKRRSSRRAIVSRS